MAKSKPTVKPLSKEELERQAKIGRAVQGANTAPEPARTKLINKARNDSS